MKLIKDTHTHTYFSHGNNSVEEMVDEAYKKGLKGISITEHGHKHYYARKITPDVYRQMRDEVLRMREKYPQMDITFGIEANIIGVDGTIDVEDEIIDLFDEISVGFHVLCGMKNLSSYIKIHLLAILSYRLHLKFFEKYSVKNCTKAVLNMLDKYDIYLMTHPMSNYKFDLYTVAKKCVEKNTLLEINNPRGHLTVEHIKSIMDTGVKFAVGSDAHDKKDVANVANSFRIITESKLSLDRVVNVEEYPNV